MTTFFITFYLLVILFPHRCLFSFFPGAVACLHSAKKSNIALRLFNLHTANSNVTTDNQISKNFMIVKPCEYL